MKKVFVSIYLCQLCIIFRDINPMSQVPAYVEYDSFGKPTVITQSLAIMEYLQDKYPGREINILPGNIIQRAKVL